MNCKIKNNVIYSVIQKMGGNAEKKEVIHFMKYALFDNHCLMVASDK